MKKERFWRRIELKTGDEEPVSEQEAAPKEKLEGVNSRGKVRKEKVFGIWEGKSEREGW